MDFQRARNDEQREQRRQLILAKAAEMLAEMPVAELSLNELSRQVGLAKSNVLRYFETREAILLELLSAELKSWAGVLDDLPVTAGGTQRQRIDHLASMVTDSLTARPLLCDLASAQAAVLERNVSMTVVLSHKLAVRAVVERVADTFRRHLPELTREDALQAISVVLLMTAAAWPHSTPTQAVLDAYKAEPRLAELHLGFADYVRGTLEVFLSGILARKPDAGP
ncbi:TetR/AcrR family transcriptional regulator [Paracoccus sp. M683]|uniref:TetR/AcrR family transcriptional regulator n=1 Tax=Paracoccus sp. M683 TaxID=2594268 RepID=UPI00117F51B2|nr:TetR family transcriptional regulator [Paracoccus sp. M683]TRW99325.1 TetR/AcrR family transcriptional regulator [Paracoccus sp. M683]